MRIALLSPYSWTYPGGVTRHIEALASELAAGGHEARVLAPFDPDDALVARLHRGARPQPRSVPDGLRLARAHVGLPANGAVSNMALTPRAVLRAAPRAARRRLRRRCTSTSRSCRCSAGMRSCSAGELPLVGTFHTYSENVLTNGLAAVPLGGRRRMNRLHVRIAVSEAAAWTARRFYGGRYRIIPNGVHLLDGAARRRAAGALATRRCSAGRCGSCSSARRSNARGCRCCCARSRRCASRSRRRSRSSARAARRSRT